MVENQSVFRKEMLDRLASPEKLDDYIKVSNPGLFTVLVAVVLLLIALCVWSFFVQLDTIVTVAAISDGQTVTVYLPEREIVKVDETDSVRIDGNDFSISYVPKQPIQASDVMDKYQLHVSGLSAEDWVYPIKLNGVISSGTYSAKVIEESHSIISYLIN